MNAMENKMDNQESQFGGNGLTPYDPLSNLKNGFQFWR